MNRRNFFGAFSAVVASCFLPAKAASVPWHAVGVKRHWLDDGPGLMPLSLLANKRIEFVKMEDELLEDGPAMLRWQAGLLEDRASRLRSALMNLKTGIYR